MNIAIGESNMTDQESIVSKEFLTFLVVTVLTISTMYAPQPLLNTIQQVYPQYSDSTIALLVTVVLIPLGIAPFIYGFFLSSFDTKRVLQCCIGLMSLGCLGIYFATSFPALLFFRLLHGLISPAILTCLMAHISAKFQGALLQAALATYIAATIGGGLVGRLSSGFVASLLGWKMIFLILGVALLLILIPVSYLKNRAKNPLSHIKFTEFQNILCTHGIKRLLFIDGCGFFVFGAISTYLPFFLAQISPEMSEWRISLVYLGYGIGIFIAIFSHKISAVVGSRIRTIRLGAVIYVCSLSLFLIPNPIYTCIGMLLVCTGQFLEHSTSPGLINRICAKRDKGAVNGLYLSVYYMGGAIGSYFPGLIYNAWGWEMFILSMGIALFTVLLATIGLDKYVPEQ